MQPDLSLIGHLLAKARDLDPLKDEDFVILLSRMSVQLRKAVEKQEALTLRMFVDRLDINWYELTPKQATRLIEAASAVITGSVDKVIPKTSKVFKEAAQAIIPSTRRHVVDRHKLPIDRELSKIDKNSGLRLLLQQESFISHEIRRRGKSAANRAERIVLSGLDEGIGSDEIVTRLRGDVMLAGLARSKAYWEVVATSFLNRARTATQLNAYAEAGIKTYRFVAVLDEATTEICRYMDGRVFRVRDAVKQQRKSEKLTDADKIRDVQPWVSVGMEEGGRFLYYEKKGQRVKVANVRRSGVGRQDDAGVFSDGLNTPELAAAGLLVPPLHANCRSTIVTEEA
jgi:SPP1 gp7 family putative phage head morphogenesis protein